MLRIKILAVTYVVAVEKNVYLLLEKCMYDHADMCHATNLFLLKG